MRRESGLHPETGRVSCLLVGGAQFGVIDLHTVLRVLLETQMTALPDEIADVIGQAQGVDSRGGCILVDGDLGHPPSPLAGGQTGHQAGGSP